MRIDGLSREEEKNLKVKYTIETVCSIMMLVSIMAVEYYLVVWRLKVDEKASFKMIEFFPLRVIAANKSIYKAIKKETSKVETWMKGCKRTDSRLKSMFYMDEKVETSKI